MVTTTLNKIVNILENNVFWKIKIILEMLNISKVNKTK